MQTQLSNQDNMGAPMLYRPERTQRVVRFFETVLRRPDNPFAPCRLRQWEVDFIAHNLGYDDDHRMLEVPKVWEHDGHRLDTIECGGPGLPMDQFAAGLGLYMLVMNEEPAAEVYLKAPIQEAGQVFRAAASMVEVSPQLRAKLKVVSSRKVIVSRKSPDCSLRIISADGDAQDYCAIFTRRRNG